MPLDIYDNQSPQPTEPAEGIDRNGRPYIGITFECCRVYARVYRNPGEPFYHGRCPKCLRMIRLRVGPDGTPSRFFTAE